MALSDEERRKRYPEAFGLPVDDVCRCGAELDPGDWLCADCLREDRELQEREDKAAAEALWLDDFDDDDWGATDFCCCGVLNCNGRWCDDSQDLGSDRVSIFDEWMQRDEQEDAAAERRSGGGR